jgi:hypothetical protein
MLLPPGQYVQLNGQATGATMMAMGTTPDMVLVGFNLPSPIFVTLITLFTSHHEFINALLQL